MRQRDELRKRKRREEKRSETRETIEQACHLIQSRDLSLTFSLPKWKNREQREQVEGKAS